MVMPNLKAVDKDRLTRTHWVFIGIFAAVVGAIAIDTTIIRIGSEDDVRQQVFSPDIFGANEFVRIRNLVNASAVEATTLSEALNVDKASAVREYGTMAGAFPIFPVKFTGTISEGTSGVFEVIVEGLPKGVKVRVQSGPAINGTELRDIPGDIEFGAFTNQIEYQDAGAAINRAMSAEILNDLDRDGFSGRTVVIVGVFKLINPKNWLVTPVEFDVR